MDSTSDNTLFKEKEFQEMKLRHTPFIGRGGYGEVYGPHSWTDKVCAVKRILFRPTDKQENFIKACELWKSLRHRNIIPVYNVTFDSPALYIVMEYGSGGSLDKVLKKRTAALPMKILKDWSIQIAEGMEFLHKKNVVHRDLKAANILVMEQDAASDPYGKTLKITDFDQIRQLEYTMTMTQFGTCAWMAIEIIDDGSFSKKSDAYSYGVVLWELLSRKLPHQDVVPTKIIYEKQNRSLNLEIEDSWPDLLKTIHKRCVLYERSDRPTFAEILRALQNPNDELLQNWAEEEQKKEKSTVTKNTIFNSFKYLLEAYPKKSLFKDILGLH